MRTFVFLLVAGGLTCGFARAERLDLATVKCSEFFASGKDNIGRVMMWLEAYYSVENASPVIDFTKMRDDEVKLGDYCAKNPDDSLITAAEKLMGQ